VNDLWGAGDVGTMQYRAGDFIHCSASTTLTCTSRPPPAVPPYRTTCFESCYVMLIWPRPGLCCRSQCIASSCHLAYTILRMP